MITIYLIKFSLIFSATKRSLCYLFFPIKSGIIKMLGQILDKKIIYD